MQMLGGVGTKTIDGTKFIFAQYYITKERNGWAGRDHCDRKGLVVVSVSNSICFFSSLTNLIVLCVVQARCRSNEFKMAQVYKSGRMKRSR